MGVFMAGKTQSGIDQRAQIAAIKVTESAANTKTVGLFAFPFSIMDKMALNIHRIEYWPSYDQLVGTGDGMTIGLICAKDVTDLTVQTDPAIVHSVSYYRLDAGTAANYKVTRVPDTYDFANLPGGGLLVPPNPLGVCIKGSSLGSAGVVWVRIHYTYLQLSTEEYWQLVEARRVISDS